MKARGTAARTPCSTLIEKSSFSRFFPNSDYKAYKYLLYDESLKRPAFKREIRNKYIKLDQEYSLIKYLRYHKYKIVD